MPAPEFPVPDFAFIFDMDGVVADTVELHYRSWQRLADEEGVPFTRERNAELLGRTRREALGVFLAGRVLSEPDAAAWMERKQAYFLEELAALGPRDALPGVRDLLAEAREQGVPLGLASSSRNVRVVLRALRLDDAFDVIADGSVVSNAKPAPDVFVWTAGRLGLPPRRCVVFEDAPAGVQAAAAGGFHVVGLGSAPGLSGAQRRRPDLRGATVREFALPWTSTPKDA